jgi:hypothetical protein
MAQPTFDRETYNREYYKTHKQQLNQKKAEQYGEKKLADLIQKMDLNVQLRQVIEALTNYDENDKSAENILWYNQIITYAKMITVLKHACVKEEDKEKIDLEWIIKIPTIGPRLPPVPTNI